MVAFNKIILIGNLTRDPEQRFAPSGLQVTNFGLAVNRRFRQGDEQKEEVCYVDIVAFDKQAELCSKYLNKGDGAIIEGRLQQRRWETEDGQRRNKHEVVAQTVTFLPKRQSFGPESEHGGMGIDEEPGSHAYGGRSEGL
ncbi:MAG: single-stranded DNA-binding protein [Nitrospira sp.]|nr:single-stranded DNA-binding protein [Nitrospira sp.]MDD9860447.1 single-stranded DNA-binding protein [Nitrospira sp.]